MNVCVVQCDEPVSHSVLSCYGLYKVVVKINEYDV